MGSSETCTRRRCSSTLSILRLRRRPYCVQISTLVLLALQCLTMVPRAGGQVSSADVNLRVLLQGEVSSFWNVVGAGLREDFSGTAGYVKVQNLSGVPIQHAIFTENTLTLQGGFASHWLCQRRAQPVPARLV